MKQAHGWFSETLPTVMRHCGMRCAAADRKDRSSCSASTTVSVAITRRSMLKLAAAGTVFAKAGFAEKRKQLHNSLAHGLHLEVLWPSALFNSGWSLLALIPVLATLALLGGVALYLASEKR